MTDRKFTQADLDAVSDTPELTAQQLAAAVPFDQAFPDLAESIRRRGLQKSATKVSTTIRLSPDIIEHFRAGGRGWQGRIDQALRQWVAERGAG